MREINFRAWHAGHKHAAPQMLYDEKPGDCLVWQSQGQNITQVMQYTGLKDKNGREIYEGDLVQNERFTALVVWSDHHQWGYKIVRGETLLINAEFPLWHEDKKQQYECKDLTVIGNIYENPELLEV